MKLKSGDMLFMNVENGAMALQIIGRSDVPRVEKEGYYDWRDGAKAILDGADVAELLYMIAASDRGGEIGGTGLSVKFGRGAIPGLWHLVLSADGRSAELSWPERVLLMHAIRSHAWRLFT